MRLFVVTLLIPLSLFTLVTVRADLVGMPYLGEGALESSIEIKTSGLSGEQLFVVCSACHSLEIGAAHRLGPNLSGIYEKHAATRHGFTYSEALRGSGIVWDRGSLLGWVMSTETMVPGTWMLYHNHLTLEESMRLVDYIISGSQK